MPRVVITHAVEDIDRWLQGSAERAAAIESGTGSSVTDYVAADGSSSIAVTADVSDVRLFRACSHRRQPKSWQRCKHTALSNQFRSTSKRTPKRSAPACGDWVGAGAVVHPGPDSAAEPLTRLRETQPQPRVSRAATASPRRPHSLRGAPFAADRPALKHRTHRGVTVGAGSRAVQDTIGSTPGATDL